MPSRISCGFACFAGRLQSHRFPFQRWHSARAAGLVLFIGASITMGGVSSFSDVPPSEIALAPGAHDVIPLTYFAMNLAGSAWTLGHRST
jgi:hypothetical protein